jgi:lipopolysaccharide export system protein LptA
MRTLTAVLAFVLATLPAAPARAEKADREKEIQVLADRLVADETKQEAVYEGNVVVTQGTLRIAANRIVVREDSEGYRSFVANGTPVTFRQKRDKVDDWIEGWALRAEFDDRSELLRLYSSAKLKSAQGELTGDFISYDRGKELFQVTGAAPGAAPSPESRVKATIVPQKRAAPPGKEAPKPDEPVTLKPETSTGKAN